MPCKPGAPGVTRGHRSAQTQLSLSLSSCHHQRGAFTRPGAGEWLWHHAPAQAPGHREHQHRALAAMAIQAFPVLGVFIHRLLAHTPLQSLCNVQTSLPSAWSFKSFLGHAKSHHRDTRVVPAPLCGLPRAVHAAATACSPGLACPTRHQISVLDCPALFLDCRASTAPTLPALPALTSACPPGVRVLLQRSHFRQNLCQSLPREDTFSAAGDRREG